MTTPLSEAVAFYAARKKQPLVAMIRPQISTSITVFDDNSLAFIMRATHRTANQGNEAEFLLATRVTVLELTKSDAIAPLCDAYIAEKAAKTATEQRRDAATAGGNSITPLSSPSLALGKHAQQASGLASARRITCQPSSAWLGQHLPIQEPRRAEAAS